MKKKNLISLFSLQIKIVLSDSPQNRKHEDMVALEKILTPKIRAFARFTLPQRIAILKRIRYSAFPTGATVLKEGHLPFCFYIIISGQVDVLKNQTDRILRLSILNRGDSFGDVGLQGVLASRRTASIVVSADAEFLVLDKDDYIEILFGENAGAEIKQRLEMVKSIPLFRDNAMHETVLHQLVMKTETRVFENGGVSILEENEVNKYLFFIVSGSVSLRKTVNYKTKSKSTASITSQATSVSSEKSLKTDLEDGLNGSSLVAIETTQQSTETSFQLLQEINQSATGDFLNDSSYLVSSNRRASATQIITSASEKSHSFLNLSARYPIARALSTSRLPDNPYENASVSQTLIEQALLSTTEGESSSRRNSLAKKYVDASRKGCFNSNLALVDKNSNTCIQLDDDSFSVSATTVPTTMADSTVDIGVLSKFKMDFQQIANGKNVDDGNNYSDLHKSKVRLPEKSADADSKSPGATRRPKSAITFEFANEQKKHKSPSSSARQSRHRVKSALTSRPSSSSRPGSPFKPKRSTSSSTLRPGSANRKSNSSLHSKSDDEGGDGNSEEQSEGPVFLEIAVLTQGSSFPEIAKPTMFPPESVCLMLKDYSSGAHKLPEDHLNETVDQEIKHRLGEAGYEYPSYTTALTEGPVKCLTISRLEFLRIAPPIMVRMMFELLFECYIPLEELEEELEEKMLWVRYRKDVARQIRIEKNKIKQLEKDRSVSC